MRRFTLLTLVSVLFIISSCKKDDPGKEIYMGTAYTGQSIPLNIKYSYSKGTYSTWVSFIDQSSYSWSQTDVNGTMPTMVVPCGYNATTGEFSDTTIVTNGDNTFGAIKYFPTSFCINDSQKLYVFTYDAQRDTNLILPRTIAEKTMGSEGTIEGTYKSSFKSRNWYGNLNGSAETKIEGEVNYTYEAGTFHGTSVIRYILSSDISVPEYGIGIGSVDSTHTETFSGTWEYNELDNTISETITSPKEISNTYTPYWVSYNNKLYLVTSLTRFYQKVNTVQ